MKILDCTLRDGGYYNEWDFDPGLVQRYLQAMSCSGVDFVELGLRNFPKEGFLGPFAYSAEAYLKTLSLPDGVDYGVMVDAKTILSAPCEKLDAVDTLFVDASESCVSLVRIAAHFHEVEESKEIAESLKAKGYIVGFNLMQAAGKSSDVLAGKAKEISSWSVVDVLYFADSLGNMDEQEVLRIAGALKTEWTGELGIHTHNNMARALDNSIAAMNGGVLWLDSTVTGMGRGAGNTPTESLMATLVAKGFELNPMPVYELVVQDFEPMQKIYGWGSSLLYFLGAQHNVHPTYIQNLLSNSHVETKEVVGAIGYLMAQDGTNKYDGKVLEAALNLTGDSSSPVGQSISGMFEGREVLLVTNAPGVQRHRQAIELFIKNKKPVVIAINLAGLESSLIDYYCVSHNVKFLSDANKYDSLEKPVILPKHRFKAGELELFCENSDVVDYGFSIEKDVFRVASTHCVAPYDLTSVYALSVAVGAGASKIYLAGFDGYESGDERQAEMIDVFQRLTSDVKSENGVDMLAITPTSYPVPKGSVYAEL